MSSQWHYTEKGQQKGPISAEQLKQRAASGALTPDDLVWKDGMAQWVPASKVKGLLARPRTANPPPPPLPQAEAKTTGFVGALKTTGSLAAKQAERTRLVTISLNGAYYRLGKAVYEANLGREAFGPQYSALDSLKKQMTAPSQPSEPTPQPQGFAQRAKVMAKATADATQRKVAKTRFDHGLATLGKGAYQKRNELPLPRQDVAGIESVLQQVAAIDAEIKQLSAQKPAQSLINNRLVHSVLTIGCFPIGLFLIWKSDQWSKRAKWLWTGGVAGLLVLGYYGSVVETRAMNAALARANTAWDSGKEAEAVDLYRAILDDHWYMLDDADRASSLRRVVEYDVNHDNEPAARKLLEKAMQQEVAVSFDDERAQQLQSDVRAEFAATGASSGITADYLPHKPGARSRTFIEMVQVRSGGESAGSVQVADYSEDGTIERTTESIGTFADGEYRSAEFTNQRLADSQLRVQDGFIESLFSDGLWRRELKIGAGVGDTWQSLHSDGIVETSRVMEFDQYHIPFNGKTYPSVAIQADMNNNGDPMLTSTATYVKGIGLVEKDVFSVKDGTKTLTARWRLDIAPMRNATESERKMFE